MDPGKIGEVDLIYDARERYLEKGRKHRFTSTPLADRINDINFVNDYLVTTSNHEQ